MLIIPSYRSSLLVTSLSLFMSCVPFKTEKMLNLQNIYPQVGHYPDFSNNQYSGNYLRVQNL